MDSNVTVAALLSGILFGSLGYVARSLWDSYTRHHDAIRIEAWKIKAEELERRLADFYWPIYLRLQRDNVVWERILDRFQQHNPEDEERRRVAYQLESTVIIPNHIEISKIIQSSIHLAEMDKKLEELVLRYLRHVDVYTSIRGCGITDKDPVTFNEPWPNGLFEAVQKRLFECQREYDEHMRDHGFLNLMPHTSPRRVSAPRTESGGSQGQL
jgi:hypothetical protein